MAWFSNRSNIMIVIRVKVRVKPQEKAKFLSAMTASIPESKQFAGCARFELCQDVQDDHQFLLYEEWETLADFDAYRNSEYFKTSTAPMFGLMDGEPDTA